MEFSTLKLSNAEVEKIIEPIRENIKRSQELAGFAVEKGWSEEEFYSVVGLLHSTRQII